MPYFHSKENKCPPKTQATSAEGKCHGCGVDLPDEEFRDWQIANHTIHALRYARGKVSGLQAPSVVSQCMGSKLQVHTVV
jgi:hypothetical protein